MKNWRQFVFYNNKDTLRVDLALIFRWESARATSDVIFMCLSAYWQLTIIPRARVGYEVIDSQRGA